MSHTLRLEEMVDSLTLMGEHEYARIFRGQLELIGTQMAQLIAQKLDIEYGDARCEEAAFAGCCATFHPKRIDQETAPYPIDQFDSKCEWESEIDTMREEAARQKHDAQMAG